MIPNLPSSFRHAEEFELVGSRLGSKMDIYQYVNRDLGENANMWVCTESCKVIYQTKRGITDWHGWCTLSTRKVELKCMFHFRGNDAALKSTRCVKEGAGLYIGRDYASRHITMRYLESKRWCYSCRCWHTMVDAEPGR